ncbi:MAG: cobalt-precorrin-5B (C(1))-methyltransferase CbiD [Peptococcaceae bacterium]|nr:cobalt-precorrin-5B (C(1))-methyltransferase CbiD [Peptococcaceae bacterium]MDH7525792.1 cobalt-precorrin-5B (C(1))-methyltransferase CbiD [Peptococcaceae bacterium]
MNLGSRWINGRELRRGYTTGSCAAAAAKAAAAMLFGGPSVPAVEIETPAGVNLTLEICESRRQTGEASCAVKKDAGDDPDITDGLLIWATAREAAEGIAIKGGPGVGVVRKPGLAVGIGQPAINPVPRQMIENEVARVLPSGKGVEIIVSIPGGEELAPKTLNPKLGIEGGLSILGTTGIVEPMSDEAWQESLRLELKQLAQLGAARVILVPGNYGQDFVCRELGLAGRPLVRFGNFAGYVLRAAAALGFRELLLVGDLGKLIKVSAGIFNTHSAAADARMEIMAAYAGLLGAKKETIRRVLETNTTAAALELLENEGITGLPGLVARRASERARSHIDGKAAVGTVLFSASRGLLAMDEEAKRMVEKFYRE